MTIRFSCPTCGKKYKVDHKLAGKAAKCSACKERILVPAIAPEKTFGAPHFAERSESAIRQDIPRNKRWVVPAILGTLVVMATGCGIVLLLLNLTRTDAQPRMEKDVLADPLPPKANSENHGTVTQRQPNEVAVKTEAKAEKDPVALLKPLLEKIQTQGTAQRVTNFRGPNSWCKRKYRARELGFDVQKTDSLVSPYVARVTWTDDAFVTADFPTKKQAEDAELPAKPLPAPTDRRVGTRWWASLAFQEGEWVVKDLGWKWKTNTSPFLAELEPQHSALDDEKNPVMDWWWAFGGM